MSSKVAAMSALKEAQKSIRAATKAMNAPIRKSETMEGGKKKGGKKGAKKSGKKGGKKGGK